MRVGVYVLMSMCAFLAYAMLHVCVSTLSPLAVFLIPSEDAHVWSFGVSGKQLYVTFVCGCVIYSFAMTCLVLEFSSANASA